MASPESRANGGCIRIAGSRKPERPVTLARNGDRKETGSAQRLSCPHSLSEGCTTGPPASDCLRHPARETPHRRKSWRSRRGQDTEHNRRADLLDPPSGMAQAVCSHTGSGHRRSKRRYHRAQIASHRNLAHSPNQSRIPRQSSIAWGGNSPNRATCGGFWKADIDRMGSDLAKRPSESAPANRGSSESEKSNDSSRIKGVWKSGSNCVRISLSNPLDNSKVKVET